MTALERMKSLFDGNPTDRLLLQPICMTFAARVAGVPYYDYVTDYRVLVETQLRAVEKFGLDVVTLCSDPAREAADCGTEVHWFPDQPPAHDPQNSLLKQKWQLRTLKQPDPLGGGRMHDRVKGAELFRKEIGGDVPILGWIEGPMAEAADLRGINEIMLDVSDDPEFVRDLFEFIAEMEIAFARAQIEAGVDVMGIGDAAASLVGRRVYRELVLPFERRMIDAIHEMGCAVRLHICGNVNHLLDDIATLDLEMIDIDCLTDIRLAREKLPQHVAVLGNMDPVRYLLNGTPDEVLAKLKSDHETIGPFYVAGPGCEVPPNTPYENIRVMREYVDSVSP